MKVIFELPAEFGRIAHPLVYLEWYTPFRRTDPIIGLYQVSPSTRNHVPNAAVVSADRILGYCHLSSKCSAEIDASWTSENVLDMARTFYVNPYLSLDSFFVSGLFPASACLQ